VRLVQNSRLWQVGYGETRAHRAVAKVRILYVGKVAIVHKANAAEYFVVDQQAARRSMLHRSCLIELAVIGFAIAMMKTGVRPPRVKTAACAPDLALVVMKHNFRGDHIAPSSFHTGDQGLQQLRIELGVVIE
jgi:hypothetical protein